MNYTPYHVHTMFSNGVTNIDSITDYRDIVEKAKKCGMEALGFSDHGSVFSWYNKKECIEAANMKYIHGIEVYVTERLDEKIRDNYHCILLARNYDGVLEINRLSSKSFNREDGHYYYVPRITFEELISTSENVIVTTACLASILNRGSNDLKQRFISFLVENKDRCFLEIQHHLVEDQITYNRYLYNLSLKTGLRLVTGTDTHALNPDQMEGREMMQKAKNVRFTDEESWDLTFKTYEELVAAYKKQNALPMNVVLQAIENTNTIADMVEPFEMDYSYKYPHLWENPEGLFREKIRQGIHNRGVDRFPNYQEYLDRIEYEIKAYKHNGAIDFMLLMEDIISWCKTQDIQVGYGRGSVNGSVIAWLLGITEMDSIKFKLNFDRFMNVERVSLSDIDTDFPPSRIEEVKDYIFSKHGLWCSDIITFNTVADKGAIRDIGRALDIPLDEVGKICDAVDIEDEYKKVRKKYKELFKYVDMVKGVIVSIGTHPCGVLVVPFPIDSEVGLCSTATSKYPVSQLYMKEVDHLNYVKLDLLKLDTIELINETCKLAGIERLTPDNVDISDPRVWKEMREDTTGIFQWEGKTGDEYIKKLMSDENIKAFSAVNPTLDRMTLLSIGNSAIRPAGASYRDDLANGVVRKTGSPAIDEFLSSTFGYLVFQCQIIDFLHLYCGFTMGEADTVRRGFAKKTGTDQYIPRIKDGFIKTMTEKYGSSVEKAETDIVAFIKVIEDASNYLFSLNHSQPYSFEGYVSAYLRTYHPLEFLTVALNINKGNAAKTAALIKYAKKVSIDIRNPVFRKARANYFFDRHSNAIYKGVGSIKHMNDKISEELYEMKDAAFGSFVDLLVASKDLTTTNSRQMVNLIKIDYFVEFGNSNQLLHVYEAYQKLWDTANKRFKKQIKKSSVQDYGLTEEFVKAFSHKETDKTYMMVDCYGILKEMETLGYKEVPIIQKASWQQVILGETTITDPAMSGVCVIGDVDDKWSAKISGYSLKNGGYSDFKIPKNIFIKKPLVEGDVVKILDYTYKPKQVKNDEGKYVASPDDKQLWITGYKILFASEMRKN